MTDFSTKRLSAEEFALVRSAYAETYPVRPLLNHIDDLVDLCERAVPALRSVGMKTWIAEFKAMQPTLFPGPAAEADGKRPVNWFDGGYLENGHCSFMQSMNGMHYCCCLPHDHEGQHRAHSQAGTEAKP